MAIPYPYQETSAKLGGYGEVYPSPKKEVDAADQDAGSVERYVTALRAENSRLNEEVFRLRGLLGRLREMVESVPTPAGMMGTSYDH